MPQEPGIFEAMYTLRALRRFKPDPVSREAIHRVIEAATKAPSASNLQTWRFIVVQDRALKEKVGGCYRQAFERYVAARPPDPDPKAQRRRERARWMADHMADVPVLILACIDHQAAGSPAPGAGSAPNVGQYASIYPAVQNLLLAARALGLATVLTTMHRFYEKEVKQALGIPEHVETCALIPLGYPDGVRFGPTARKPVGEVTYQDRWGVPFRR